MSSIFYAIRYKTKFPQQPRAEYYETHTSKRYSICDPGPVYPRSDLLQYDTIAYDTIRSDPNRSETIVLRTEASAEASKSQRDGFKFRCWLTFEALYPSASSLGPISVSKSQSRSNDRSRCGVRILWTRRLKSTASCYDPSYAVHSSRLVDVPSVVAIKSGESKQKDIIYRGIVLIEAIQKRTLVPTVIKCSVSEPNSADFEFFTWISTY